jgi:hypothetical protein
MNKAAIKKLKRTAKWIIFSFIVLIVKYSFFNKLNKIVNVLISFIFAIVLEISKKSLF